MSRVTRSSRFRAAVLLTVAAAALGVLGLSGIDEGLVYYRTPTEVAQEPPAEDDRVRVGGMVVPGSVTRSDGTVRLQVTDGAHEIEVLHEGALPQIFEEGQGAVVEGHYRDGMLRSDLLMVRHSNEYRPPDGVAEFEAGGGR